MFSMPHLSCLRSDTFNLCLRDMRPAFECYVCVCAKSLHLCLTLCNPMYYRTPNSSVHGILQAWNPGVGCHALLQGIFQTQGSNPHFLCFLHWQVGSLPPAPPGKPKVLAAQLCPTLCWTLWSCPASSVHGILQARILEWVAIPFSRGSSQLRDQTQVSCIAGRFFIIWATDGD